MIFSVVYRDSWKTCPCALTPIKNYFRDQNYSVSRKYIQELTEKILLLFQDIPCLELILGWLKGVFVRGCF